MVRMSVMGSRLIELRRLNFGHVKTRSQLGLVKTRDFIMVKTVLFFMLSDNFPMC